MAKNIQLPSPLLSLSTIIPLAAASFNNIAIPHCVCLLSKYHCLLVLNDLSGFT